MNFNSAEYDWASITLTVGGIDIEGIRGVKFSRKSELEEVHAKGRDAHTVQRGNNTNEIELTMLQSSFDAIEDAAFGDILKAVVDVTCSFGNTGDVIRTHRALGVRFSEDGFDAKQGDKFIEIKVPGKAWRILKNV